MNDLVHGDLVSVGDSDGFFIQYLFGGKEALIEVEGFLSESYWKVFPSKKVARR